MGNEQSKPVDPDNPNNNRARSLSPLLRDPDNGEASDNEARLFPATQPVPKKSRYGDPSHPEAEADPESPAPKSKKKREHRRNRTSGNFSATQPIVSEQTPASPDERPASQPELFSRKKKSKGHKSKKKARNLQPADEEAAGVDAVPGGVPVEVAAEEPQAESAPLRKKKRRRRSKGSEVAEDMPATAWENSQEEQFTQWSAELEEYRSEGDHLSFTKAPPPEDEKEEDPVSFTKAPPPEDEEEATQLNSSKHDYDLPEYKGTNGSAWSADLSERGSPTVSESSLPQLPKDDDHVVKYRDDYPEHSGDEEQSVEHDRSLSQPKGREMSKALDDDDGVTVNGNLKPASPSPSPLASPRHSQRPDPALPTSSAGAPRSQSSRRLKVKVPFFERDNEERVNASSDAVIDEAESPLSHQPGPSQPRSSQFKKGKKSREPRPEIIPESDLEDTPVASKSSVTYGKKASQKSSQVSSRRTRRLPTPEAAPDSQVKAAPESDDEAAPSDDEAAAETDVEVAPEIVPDEVEPAPATNGRPSKKSSKKNRSQPPPEEAPESDLDAANASPEPQATNKKNHTKKSAPKSSQKTAPRSSQRSSKAKKPAPVVESSPGGSKEYVEDELANESEEDEEAPATGYKVGVMTKTEVKQITKAVELFRETEGLSQEEVNSMIQDNPQKVGTDSKLLHKRLWELVVESCPTRRRSKLILWCRKHFHNFVARGKWTNEQDDHLDQLVKTYGKSWVKIGSMVNRHPDDVRDRYRNYVVCRGTVKTDLWSVEEEEKLREVYQNALRKIQEKMDKTGDKEHSADDLINWQLISDDMGRTRSRLQCQEKWKRLAEAEPLADRDKVVTLLPAGNNGWRIKKARRDLKSIGAPEKYTLVNAIRAGGYEYEREITWKQIVEHVFKKEYERQALVVVWGRLKQAVPDYKEKTVNDCATFLVNMYKKEGNFGTELVYDDGVASEDESSVRANSARKKGKGEKKSRSIERRNFKTPAEAISDDSDAEEPVQMSVGKEMEDPDATTVTRPTPETADISQISPTFNGVPVANSPSVVAEASRARRRERSASVPASVAASLGSESKSKDNGKSRERQKRDQESAAAAAAVDVIPQSPAQPQAASQEQTPDRVKRSSKKRRLLSSESREHQERDQESAAADVIPQSPAQPQEQVPDSIKRSSKKRRLLSSESRELQERDQESAAA
ncbi:hypothetical protein QBC38DRAFT_490686, partial [Podospora fimiseda]